MDEETICVCSDRKDNVFDDNVLGHCAGCGCEIMWRPSVPPCIKLCIGCGLDMINDAEDRGDDVSTGLYPGQKEEIDKHIGADGYKRAMDNLEFLRGLRKLRLGERP